MSLKQSEAIVLRTYPLREADLLVTLFTRAEGKVKGIARAAKKSKRRFGGALEPLTWVRAYYEDREGQELARLDSCDILESPLSATVDYPRVAALAGRSVTKSDLLKARVIITAYNQHRVDSFLPSLGLAPQCTRVGEPTLS
jgi:DNA repair protein RecO (recombination protein O)